MTFILIICSFVKAELSEVKECDILLGKSLKVHFWAAGEKTKIIRSSMDNNGRMLYSVFDGTTCYDWGFGLDKITIEYKNKITLACLRKDQSKLKKEDLEKSKSDPFAFFTLNSCFYNSVQEWLEYIDKYFIQKGLATMNCKKSLKPDFSLPTNFQFEDICGKMFLNSK